MKLKLAQLNLAQLTMPPDHPDMADFINNLDRINAIADQSTGFIWRYTEEDYSASMAVFGSDMLVNMSVWESLEDLMEFTYKSPHLAIYKRRKEWFAKMDSPHMVCWFVEEGHIPSLEEAKARIVHLEQQGETPFAFSFKNPFGQEEVLAYSS